MGEITLYNLLFLVIELIARCKKSPCSIGRSKLRGNFLVMLLLVHQEIETINSEL